MNKLILLIALAWSFAAGAVITALPEEVPPPTAGHSRICLEDTTLRVVRCSKMMSDKKIEKYKAFKEDARYFSDNGADLKLWPKEMFDLDDYQKVLEPILCKAAFDRKTVLDTKIAKISTLLTELETVKSVSAGMETIALPPSTSAPARRAQ